MRGVTISHGWYKTQLPTISLPFYPHDTSQMSFELSPNDSEDIKVVPGIEKDVKMIGQLRDVNARAVYLSIASTPKSCGGFVAADRIQCAVDKKDGFVFIAKVLFDDLDKRMLITSTVRCWAVDENGVEHLILPATMSIHCAPTTKEELSKEEPLLSEKDTSLDEKPIDVYDAMHLELCRDLATLKMELADVHKNGLQLADDHKKKTDELSIITKERERLDKSYLSLAKTIQETNFEISKNNDKKNKLHLKINETLETMENNTKLERSSKKLALPSTPKRGQ